ncbi:hypothetical protein [Egicoccus halophilus]|uniref:Uncharacterized protein n=1 Tax=Egicoccus halophilus TaxID=1670830 RepID=A0A8J3EY58_9ACTN|nr:hypothetical protein [Egicoccus halophilus]GGI07215.1 hypothetical protein GCM10011354_22970 [Egicoccus halophilus]
MADEAALVELTNDHYVERAIGKAAFLAAKAKLDGRIAEARRELSADDHTSALVGLPSDAEGLRRAWNEGGIGPDPDGLDDEQAAKRQRARVAWRRAVVVAMCEQITIRKAEKKGQPWKRNGSRSPGVSDWCAAGVRVPWRRHRTSAVCSDMGRKTLAMLVGAPKAAELHALVDKSSTGDGGGSALDTSREDECPPEVEKGQKAYDLRPTGKAV